MSFIHCSMFQGKESTLYILMTFLIYIYRIVWEPAVSRILFLCLEVEFIHVENAVCFLSLK